MGLFDLKTPRQTFGTNAPIEGNSYYVVVFPQNMTYEEGDVYRNIARGLNGDKTPVLLDFRNVEKFDTSGLAFIIALMLDQPNREFFSRGVNDNVRHYLEMEPVLPLMKSRLLPFQLNGHSNGNGNGKVKE